MPLGSMVTERSIDRSDHPACAAAVELTGKRTGPVDGPVCSMPEARTKSGDFRHASNDLKNVSRLAISFGTKRQPDVSMPVIQLSNLSDNLFPSQSGHRASGCQRGSSYQRHLSGFVIRTGMESKFLDLQGQVLRLAIAQLDRPGTAPVGDRSIWSSPSQPCCL